MTTATPDLYEVLGVARDATPEEIKAAYRKQASAAHPDKNKGNEAEAGRRMAAVNQANDVLSNPERRARYDATGSAKEGTTLEQEAMAAVAATFQEALGKHVPDPVAFARGDFREAQRAMAAEIDRAHGFIKQLKAKRGLVRVKTPGATNIMHDLIDSQVSRLENTIKANTRLIQVADAALQILADYEFTGDAPQRPGGMRGIFGAGELDDLMERTFRTGRF